MASAAVSPNSMWKWSQSATGSFSRPLDDLETFFAMLNSGEHQSNHWAISVVLGLALPQRLSAADAEACLRRAWLAVCHRHPGLTGYIEDESASKHLVASPLETETDDSLWLSQTFSVQHEYQGDSHGAQTGYYGYNSTVPHSKGGTSCRWLPNSQEIHIRCRHWLIDGVGMLLLADSFMKHLASVVYPDITISGGGAMAITRRAEDGLTPCFYDLVGSNLDEATTPIEHKDAADSLLITFVRGMPSIGLPTVPGSEDSIPGGTGSVINTLSVSQTKAAIAACKARRISVTSAVHAAIVRVTAKHPQHALAKSYACFFPMDLRRHLPQAPVDGECVVNNFCAALPIHISGVLPGEGEAHGKPFEAIVANTSAAYSSDLARGRQTAANANNGLTMLKLVGPYWRRATELFTTPPPPELPPPQFPMLSSLGNVEQYIQRTYTTGTPAQDSLEVKSFRLGTQMDTRQLQCHVWTWRDQLYIQGCFNVSFYESGFIKGVLDEIQRELLRGLMVN